MNSLLLQVHQHDFCVVILFIIIFSQRLNQMVTKGEDCLPPATEPSRCYSPSSTTPLAELETIRSLEIVEPSFLSPVWYLSFLKAFAMSHL